MIRTITIHNKGFEEQNFFTTNDFYEKYKVENTSNFGNHHDIIFNCKEVTYLQALWQEGVPHIEGTIPPGKTITIQYEI